jgi:hypothetical protein
LGEEADGATQIAIFATIHSHMAMFSGYTGGEGTWSKGMIKSLERQGYTVLFARNDFEYVYHLYRQFPDLVKAIFIDPSGDNNSKYTDYLKKADRPDGYPAWKVGCALETRLTLQLFIATTSPTRSPASSATDGWSPPSQTTTT